MNPRMYANVSVLAGPIPGKRGQIHAVWSAGWPICGTRLKDRDRQLFVGDADDVTCRRCLQIQEQRR